MSNQSASFHTVHPNPDYTQLRAAADLLIQQKQESEGDMQAKQASRKAMSAAFPH